MPKISEKPLRRIQLRIFEEDYIRANKLFGRDIGVNAALRTMIHSCLNQTENRVRQLVDAQETEVSEVKP